MDRLAQLEAEFETLGEAAVAERVNANHYAGAARAVAMRWLNEKSLDRIGVAAPAHGATPDPSTRRIVRAERSAQAAILCAMAALLAAIGSLGLSVRTLQAVESLRQSVAQATSPPAPPR